MIRSEKRSEKNIRRMITCLLTLAMLLGVVTIVAARIEWPTRIEQFEKYSPVYTESVETGTPEEDLGLPESLRAVTSLDELELDQNAFVQAEAESQEWESYGYTEPENADALYEAGELAVYTLEQEDGSLAYRVYGSLDGSENRWFATDEDGSLTGVVQEVPVTWSGTYDPDQAGEYTFTASFSGYTYGSARPTAVIRRGWTDGAGLRGQRSHH